MIINTNMGSINAQGNLARTSNSMQKSLEKLSSGFRINRAADDAAGLAISEKLRGQIRGVKQAQRNAQDGISLLQTAEGALNVSHSILQRMRELSVQAANGTLDAEDRSAIITEMNQLVDEIDRIAQSTQFNKKVLLNGTFGTSVSGGTLLVGADGVSSISATGAKASTTFALANGAAGTISLTDGLNTQAITGLAASFSGTLNFDNLGISITVSNINTGGAWTGAGKNIITSAVSNVDLQIGANQGGDQRLAIGINNMSKVGLNIAALDLTTTANATAATTTIDNAIKTVSLERSTIGAWQNRLEHTIENLSISSENMTAAESRIRDVDMASAMSEFTRLQILNQASVAMLAQANQTPQSILKLLG